jgi:hypothetical protein
MTLAVRIMLVVAACLIGLSETAQARRRHRPVYTLMPSGPIFVMPAPSPRLNFGGVNQPGVPNTTWPGTIGTGAVPSGLSGDSPTTPGFPGRVGRD